jgi:hypothetical protein
MNEDSKRLGILQSGKLKSLFVCFLMQTRCRSILIFIWKKQKECDERMTYHNSKQIAAREKVRR